MGGALCWKGLNTVMVVVMMIIYSYYHSRTRYREISRVHCRVLLRVRSTSNNTKAMNEWCFPGIAFYYGNNEFIVWQTCTMIGSYVATPPGNKKTISYVASNDDCPTIKWTNKKPTAEWNGCEQSRGDVLDNLLNESRIRYNTATQRRPSVVATSDSSVRSTLRTIDSGIPVNVDSLATYR